MINFSSCNAIPRLDETFMDLWNLTISKRGKIKLFWKPRDTSEDVLRLSNSLTLVGKNWWWARHLKIPKHLQNKHATLNFWIINKNLNDEKSSNHVENMSLNLFMNFSAYWIHYVHNVRYLAGFCSSLFCHGKSRPSANNIDVGHDKFVSTSVHGMSFYTKGNLKLKVCLLHTI